MVPTFADSTNLKSASGVAECTPPASVRIERFVRLGLHPIAYRG